MLSSEEFDRPSKDPDIGSQIDTGFLIFSACMLLLAYLLTMRVTDQLRSEAIVEDRVLVNLVSTQLNPDQISEAWFLMPQLDDAYALVALDESGEVSFSAQLPTDPSEQTRWQSWQNEIAQTARRAENIPFYTVDPTGAEWLHSVTQMQQGAGFVVLQRKTDDAFATARWVRNWILGAVFLVLLCASLFRPFFRRYLISPIERLGEMSDIFRLRGHLREEEIIVLRDMSARKDQIGLLAKSLRETEAQTQHRLVELETLLQTSRAVVNSLEVDEVIDTILAQVQRLFEVEQCAVVTLDPRANVFRIRASRGLSEAYVEQLRIDPTEPASPSMRALRNNSPVQIADIDADMSYRLFRDRAYAEGFLSVLSIPMRTNHARPAVLNLYKAAPYRYSYRELQIAASFANHASSAIDNAALYERSDERLQAQTQRLEAIVESLSDGLVLESLDGEVLFCNERSARMLQLPKELVRGQKSADMRIHLFRDAVQHPSVSEDIVDITHELENGRRQDLRIQTFDVEDADGERIGRGHLWQDITPDKELDRMKSALLSTVSHELRTPLATIKGYASTLLAKDVAWDETAQEEFLQTISDETDRMTRIVKTLLDMSRIEAGLLDIQPEPASLNALVHQVCTTLPKEIGRFTYALEDNLPYINLDASRISTVIRNLLTNAIKYSPQETAIDIRTARFDDAIHLTVRDYGQGIAEEDLEKIFQQFYRADDGYTRQTGGVGLGLAICKGFIEAHNGSIWVEQAAVGSIFGFSLPIPIPEMNETPYAD